MKIPNQFTIEKAYADLKDKYQSAPQELLEALAQADYFKEFCQISLAHPIGNALLGAIALGWQLRDKVAEIEAETLIYRA